MVECPGLENRYAARHRGFESHPLRHIFHATKRETTRLPLPGRFASTKEGGEEDLFLLRVCAGGVNALFVACGRTMEMRAEVTKRLKGRVPVPRYRFDAVSTTSDSPAYRPIRAGMHEPILREVADAACVCAARIRVVNLSGGRTPARVREG